MSATDELRRLLGERGISYINVESIDGSYWGIRWFVGDNISAEWRENGKRHELLAVNITPEQAIAATLGSGECGWTLVEKWPNRSGDDHVYGYETGCGERHTWWPDSLPNFCPTCGGKVVNDA